jgi:hypothetical protein
VSDSILLADSDVPVIAEATLLLDGWRAELRSPVELPAFARCS